MKDSYVIAIDGPSGSGKSTTAARVAEKLGIIHVDTGAMYRAVTLKALRDGISFKNEDSLGEMTRKMRISFRREARTQRVLLDGEDITGEIRTPEVTAAVSDYCAVPVVREILVELQRKTSESGPVVLEGRDIGTVVFPDAEFKFYMVASDKARAERRRKDFEKTGVIKTVEEIQKELIERDRKDSSREHSPLKKSDDAVVIDTTGLGIEEQVSLIIEKVLKETAE